MKHRKFKPYRVITLHEPMAGEAIIDVADRVVWVSPECLYERRRDVVAQAQRMARREEVRRHVK